MSNNYNDLHEIEGLQFIPVDAAKVPTVKNWQTSTTRFDLTNCIAVGLVCGKPSGNIEVIDIDQKYSLDGKLFDDYKRLINELDKNLLKKLVVQKTKNGGYHFIYRCSVIAGNQKLANRHTTEKEKQDTYEKTYQHEILKSDESIARDLAQKAKDHDKVRVLIETRGAGGQIVCNPSSGYEFVFGDFYSIREISVDERETLIGVARQFNSVFEETKVPKPTKTLTRKGLSAFEDYNDRGDVVELLQNHGWKVVKQKGDKTIMLRPGQVSSLTSGNYDHEKKWFSVFTTSTEFEPEKAYLPYAVFAILECGKDFSEASRKLFEMGYGEKDAPKKETTSTRVIPSRVNPNDDDYSFLATSEDYDGHLEKVRSGTLKMGLTTGSPELDKYFLFKEGELVMTNGIDNTGKSAVTWYLALLSAMYHGWEWIVFSSENTLGAFMRKCIQFYWGKQLYGQYAMSDKEFQIAKSFIEKKFKLIKAQEELYNYKDIINMVRKAKLKFPTLKYGIIDPYNSLKTDLSGFSKLSTHEYHYEALSEIKAYGQQNNFGWIINNHAVTSALRTKDADKKYPVAPRKEDTEGGGKFSNKADSFVTIHRLTQHPTDWMITELHIRKIKDTETGGKPTSLDSPVKWEMYKGGTAFIERNEVSGRGVDPIYEWHKIHTKIEDGVDFTFRGIDNGSMLKEVPPTWYNNEKDTDLPF